jgi:uncharacterized membrane protein (DUF106 family)
MWRFHSLFGKVFDLIFAPFRSMSPWVGMVLISLITGILMLLVFKWTSHQKGIRRIKDRIKAHLLELRLFKDNLGISMRAQGKILQCNLKYIAYSAKPMLVMIIPLILILIQLNFWFGYQSLAPHEHAILKVKLEKNIRPIEADVRLIPPSEIIVETPPLRISEKREINWRISVREKGIHRLRIIVGGQELEKHIAAGQRPLSRLSPFKIKRGFLREILYPGEIPLQRDIPVESIEIAYPTQGMNLFGWKIHWLIVYFVLSILFGFALKRVFRVEV